MNLFMWLIPAVILLGASQFRLLGPPEDQRQIARWVLAALCVAWIVTMLLFLARRVLQ
jgi:hypothetical protein